MPRISGLTTDQKVKYQRELLADRMEVMLCEHKIKKTQVANFVGITPQSLHNQFKTKKLSTDVLIAIATLTGDERIQGYLVIK